MESGNIKKIAIIGAESTGKTALCEQLALHFNTVWVPEFAREYFNDSDIYNYTLEDLENIALKQVELEEKLSKKANALLFCDTALITLKIWAELEFGVCPESIERFMRSNPYDYYLISNNDVAWEPDPQRLNKFPREQIFEMNREAVLVEKVPFGIVQGTGDLRILNAKEHLRFFQNKQSL